MNQAVVVTEMVGKAAYEIPSAPSPLVSDRLTALTMEQGELKVLEADNWSGYRRLQDILVESLVEAERFKLADRVRACHRDFKAYRCREDGGVFAKPGYTCKLRLCPFEMRASSMRFLHRFGPAVTKLVKPKYLVLSERNCGLYNLGEGIDSLWRAFAKLRKAALWRDVRGSVAVLEITYNREKRTWHPHLNILFDGPFLPQESLQAAWIKATRAAGRGAWICLANEGTVGELLKYITKLADFVDDFEAVEQFLVGSYRKHFLRSYGTLRDLEVEEKEPKHACCPDCGSTDVEYLGNVSLDRIYREENGVLRIRVIDFDSRAGPRDG